MKKIVFVFFALFLLMFSSCRTLSYTETEVTPSSDAYIGLLCDPNNSVHCFTIESVESYLDTFFSDKKIIHHTLGADGLWCSDTCDWLKKIANDFQNIDGKAYNIAITYHQNSIYAVAAMGEYRNDFYYADKNILYIIESNNIICKEELNLPAYNGGNSVPYAPKIFVTDQYIALHTLAGVCLLDKEGNTITDEYTVAKIDAITDNVALAEYNADYVEVLDLPTLTSQGLFKARDSYVAYPVNADSFFTFTSKGIYRYSISEKSEKRFMNAQNFQLSNEKNRIVGGTVSGGNVFYVIICDEEENFHLYKYSPE